ncbi:MAG: hypothetical protein K6C08_15160, partial [Oscillospiraceae bacterium]|nr:hypothetical protein [Oscillospiraceae bacterium]
SFLERANGLESGVMDRFLGHTGFNFGLRVKKLSAQNRQYGLQTGDLVVAIDGRLISSYQHMLRLQRLYPDAALSYLRNGKLLVTDTIPDWDISGEFIVVEKS